MFPYSGAYGSGAADRVNKFWPVLGNHDWGAGLYPNCGGRAGPYLQFFPALNGSRYYTITYEHVQFFMLDSDCSEADGTSATSVQGSWLKAQLAASTATWKVVVMHHPPHSSGSHQSTVRMQWPFQSWCVRSSGSAQLALTVRDTPLARRAFRNEARPLITDDSVPAVHPTHKHVHDHNVFNVAHRRGADATLAGHDHNYERVLKDGGFPNFVNGLGGKNTRSFSTIVSGSAARFTGAGGAQLIEANATSIVFKFHAVTAGTPLIDCYAIHKASGATTYETCVPGAMSVLSNAQLTSATEGSQGTAFRYRNVTNSGAPPAGWTALAYDDGGWAAGPAPLGYGPDLAWATTLVANGDVGGSYLFRRTFCLTQAQYDHLQQHGSALYVASDNRASVWLNGASVLAEDSTANHDISYWNSMAVSLPSGGYVVGQNVIAAQVWNTAGSSDAGFDLDIRINTGLWSTAPDANCGAATTYSALNNASLAGDATTNPAALVFRHAADTTSSLAASDWTAAGYDDGGWASGRVPMGYGPDHAWETTLASNSATGGT